MKPSQLFTALWPILGLLAAVPSSAWCPPSDWRSDVPDHLTLVGRTSGGGVDQSYPFTVIVRDCGGNPFTNVFVMLDFTGTGLWICTDQGDPRVSVDCSGRFLRAWVDQNGAFTFHVMGCANNHGRAPGLGTERLKVWADSFQIGEASIAALDQGGCDGLDGNDFSALLDDILSGQMFGRSDYDFDGSLGGNDLSIWLGAFFGGTSTSGCGNAVCPH